MASEPIDRESIGSIEISKIQTNTNEDIEKYDTNSTTEDSSGVNPVIIWV